MVATSVVIGTLGTITAKLKPFLGMTAVDVSSEPMQKSAILGTANILREMLEISV